MPTPPTFAVVKAYLGDTVGSWTEDEIKAALAAETVAQSKRCKFPADPVDANGDPILPLPAYPADLAEALCRRVAHNLALRGLPLGIQTTLTDGGASVARVSGRDAEVQRLETPYRKLTVG